MTKYVVMNKGQILIGSSWHDTARHAI